MVANIDIAFTAVRFMDPTWDITHAQ